MKLILAIFKLHCYIKILLSYFIPFNFRMQSEKADNGNSWIC